MHTQRECYKWNRKRQGGLCGFYVDSYFQVTIEIGIRRIKAVYASTLCIEYKVVNVRVGFGLVVHYTLTSKQRQFVIQLPT